MTDASIRTSDERIDLGMVSATLDTIADNWPIGFRIENDQAYMQCRHCSQAMIRVTAHDGPYDLNRALLNSSVLAHLIHAHRYEMDGSNRGN
jgi:hypothetical protein